MISSQTDAVGTCADLPDYEVYAVRYATVERRRSENFMAHDPHDGPMPMDYFVWVVRHADRVWLVDTGWESLPVAMRKPVVKPSNRFASIARRAWRRTSSRSALEL